MSFLPKLIAAFLTCFIVNVSIGQQITGKVLSAKGEPLAGASIKNIKNSRGTATHADGSFAINAKDGDVLDVSMVGYATQKVSVTNVSNLQIVMVEGSSSLDEVVLVGSRRAGRVKLETAVPVDVVNVGQIALATGRTDITSILNYVAPSFNYNKQSGSDGADHLELATLRGLGPDQTLVLINGKRRHQTAFVSVFGTRGRGNSGTDLDAIPVSSIERVEILRDGASAQYGSDAIAGVINIILKKTTGVFSGSVGASTFYDQKFNTAFSEMNQYVSHGKLDGNSISLNTNYGFPIGEKGGYFNVSADYLNTGKTFRQVLDTVLEHPDGLPINPYRRANGDGSLTAISSMYNMEIPVKGNTSLYSFGGYNHKSSSAYAFTRNLSARPERFPSDVNGNVIIVPDIMHSTPDGETYFNPLINTEDQDASMAIGLKGTCKSGWNWDISNTAGYNLFHFFGDGTFNASAHQKNLQTHFDDGGFSFFQNTSNINFDKEFTHIASGFHLAFGAEYRAERYKIFAGEPLSYANYDTLKASGSQGFPGYQPGDEVNAERKAYSAYIDGEIDVTKKLLLGGAVRVENYSDFGFTSNYKLSARYKVLRNLNIRGSVSTGFRAPSLQQENFSSTFTTVQGSQIFEVKIAPNYSPITKSAGIPELKEEKSINASLGVTLKPLPSLSISVDGYLVKIKDRIVLSGQFSADSPTLDTGFTNTLHNLKVGAAQFYANAVNTTNMGIDVVAEYNKKLTATTSIKGTFAGNLQDMSIDEINVPAKLNTSQIDQQTFLSDREQGFILASAPKIKLAASVDYSFKRFTVGARATFFGKVRIFGYGQDGLGINPEVPTDADPSVTIKDEYIYSSKLVTDLYGTFRLSRKIAFHLGVDNLFNVHPDLGIVKAAKYWAYNGESGGPWDAVQMGTNGMRMFGRVSFNF